MRILLGNTGRGGEQCIFTSIVHAYRKAIPDAFIRVASCPQYDRKPQNTFELELPDEDEGALLKTITHLVERIL